MWKSNQNNIFLFLIFFAKIYSLLTHARKTLLLRSHYNSIIVMFLNVLDLYCISLYLVTQLAVPQNNVWLYGPPVVLDKKFLRHNVVFQDCVLVKMQWGKTQYEVLEVLYYFDKKILNRRKWPKQLFWKISSTIVFAC